MDLFYNRRLLLPNEDMPSSTISTLPLLQDNGPLPVTPGSSSLPPMASTTSSSSSLSTTPLQMLPRPALNSNIAYIMLVLLTAMFFLGFISIYIRRFSDEDSVSPRRRLQRNRPSSPSSWNYYSTSSCYKGLDRATVQSLPVHTYNGGAKHQIDCAICLSEFEEGENVKMIPYCRHVFHIECIDMWLFSHVSCPICRCTKLSTAAERGGEEGRSTAEDGGRSGRNVEVGSQSERRSSICRGLEDTRRVLRRTLSY